MIQKKFTILLFMFSLFNLSAQNKVVVDLNTNTLSTNDYTQNETEINGTFYKNLNEKSALTNTVGYKNKSINYSLTSHELPVSLNQFNKIENILEFSHLLNSKTKLIIAAKPIATFEKNIDFKDIALLGGMGIEYQFNKKTSLNIGVTRETYFGSIALLPTISFYHKLNEKLAIDLGFPNTTISFTNNIRNEFKLTNNFNGSYYNLDKPVLINNTMLATTARFSNMTSSIEYDRNVDTNWFLNFKAGYEFNKKFTLEDANNNTTFSDDNNKAYIFTIGIKYKY